MRAVLNYRQKPCSMEPFGFICSAAMASMHHPQDFEDPPPMLTSSGKRRGRKPGANSTHAQRSAANARERARMRVLSRGFVDLKMVLPWVPRDTKLSKLDTLKLASAYIAYLKKLTEEEPENTCFTSVHHPLAYTWPYAFGKAANTRVTSEERHQFDSSSPLSPTSTGCRDSEVMRPPPMDYLRFPLCTPSASSGMEAALKHEQAGTSAFHQ